MTKKQIVRAVAFSLVLLCMFCFLSDVFENEPNRRNTIPVRTYYNLEEDTLDFALVGTSGIDRYWLAAKAYEERGMASFAFAINHFPSWAMLPIAKDIAKRHENLKLLIIDMRPFTANYVNVGLNRYENRARIAVEALPFFSKARFEVINRTLEIISENVEGEDRFDLSYFFTFIKHHSRWSEKNFDLYAETEYETSDYMGAFINKSYTLRKLEAPAKTYVTDERLALDPICLENLYELLEWLKTQDFEVLFLNTPHSQTETETKRQNSVQDILDKEGYKYLHCNLNGKRYDLQNDFYNPEHMNYYGAEKFTALFAEYLARHYDFPDRRGDEHWSQWEGTYANIRKTITSWEAILEKREESAAQATTQPTTQAATQPSTQPAVQAEDSQS